MPELSENRPSILYGDKILIKEPNSKTFYEGVVHRVEENKVILGLNYK